MSRLKYYNKTTNQWEYADLPGGGHAPQGGWVKSELAEDVQESLEKADESVSYEPQYGRTDAEKAQARDNINASAPDGYYGSSGGVYQYATNLLGKTSPQNAKGINFRPTASQMSGNAWTADSVSGQIATIEKIKGRTLVWNQLFTQPASRTDAGLTITYGTDEILHINGTPTNNIATFYYNADKLGITDNGSKYLTLIKCLKNVNNVSFRFSYLNARISPSNITIPAVGEYAGSIGTCDTSKQSTIGFMLDDQEVYNDVQLQIMVFNLTKMFGAGKEPQTVEEFKAYFPLDYYKHSSNRFIDTKITDLKTNGFNQFNKNTITKHAYINDANGELLPTDSDKNATDYIPVFPNMQYYFVTAGTTWGAYYDENKQFVEGIGSLAWQKTIPSNVHYIRFTVQDAYLDSTNVNLAWSGVRNGDVEPYWDNTLQLPILDYFPNGMKSTATIYDEITKDECIKRIGTIDLGTLDWVIDNRYSNKQFCVDIPNDCADSVNILCPIYNTRLDRSWTTNENKTVTITTDLSFVIVDNSYATAAEFKNAMSGVMLYYELADYIKTPTPPELNFIYKCDDFGTEMVLPQNTDVPITAPLNVEIVYQLDYEADVRNINQNTISKKSMDNFISAFNSSGLGTIAQSWDSVNKEYTYTISAPV